MLRYCSLMWSFTKKPWFRFVRRWSIRLFLGFVAISLFLVLLFKWINPFYNFTMLRKNWSGAPDYHIQKKWVPIEKISRSMQLAVICGEDQNFNEHFGFDFKALKAAAANNAKGRKIRGASTISQQTAKNVFLWGGRSYIRKGLEAWFTLLIETIWGKKRIMEVYLNVAETGYGLFGVEAAAQQYYTIPASKLGKKQAAAIASILPSPVKWKLSSYPAVRRQHLILHAMNRYGIQLKYLE